MPVERPVIVVAAAAGLPDTVNPEQPEHAGDGVTVYPVIVAPLFAGAVHDNDTDPFEFADPDTPDGAPGTVAGTTADDALDALPVPAEFVAVTVNV